MRRLDHLLTQLEDLVRHLEQIAQPRITNQNDAFLADNAGRMFQLLCEIRFNSLGELITAEQVDSICRFVDEAIARGAVSSPIEGNAVAQQAAAAPTDGSLFLARKAGQDWLIYRRTPDGVFRYPSGHVAYPDPDEWKSI